MIRVFNPEIPTRYIGLQVDNRLYMNHFIFSPTFIYSI
uniref:Uncharacterized protein n=1 Tax=Arundo donax TaxID=35708 RepID=A0A0A9F349_ARUDO